MPISALPQAPYRQDNKLFPTPLVGDVLFSEIRDCNRGNEPFPAYGTPHPNADKWPNHKLVYIKPVQIERNEIFEFFYAADRENQDLYNFQYLEGGFVLNRSYVILRSELDTFNEPADGTVDVQFSEYKYATRNVKRIDEKELDSLYVNVEHIYSKQGVEIAKSSDSKTGYSVRRVTKIGVNPITGGNSQSQLDEKGWTNQTESVIVTGGTIASAREQKPFIKIDSNSTAATIPTLPATGNGNSQLVYDNGTDKVYQNTVEVSTARTGPAGTEKDVKPFVALTANKTYSTTGDISAPTGSSNVIYNDGQTTVYEVSNVTATAKETQIGISKEVRVGYRFEHTDRYSPNNELRSNGIGDVDLVYTDGAVTAYKLRESRVYLDSKKFISSQKNTKIFKRSVETEYFSTPYGPDSDIYDSELVASDGSTNIYKRDTVTVTPKQKNTYFSFVQATRPAELTRVAFQVVERQASFKSTRDTRDKIVVKPIIKEGFTGLFPAKIVEYYQDEAPQETSFNIIRFNPTSIDYEGLTFNLQIGPTLHEQISLKDTIGTSDPEFKAGTQLDDDFKSIPATVPTKVPTGYQLHAVDIEPYEKGFVIKEIYIKWKDDNA